MMTTRSKAMKPRIGRRNGIRKVQVPYADVLKYNGIRETPFFTTCRPDNVEKILKERSYLIIPKKRKPVVHKYPPKWKGTLRLKCATADVSLRVIGGDEDLGSICIRSMSEDNRNIRIRSKTNRDEIWKDLFIKKSEQERKDMFTVLALPVEGCHSNFNMMQFMNDYLKIQKISGVVECSREHEDQSGRVAYFFPKDAFTKEHIEFLDPVLQEAISQEPYLMIVFEFYQKPPTPTEVKFNCAAGPNKPFNV